MLFAIRDDDTSFYTRVSDLTDAYDFISEGCVSLSIVPFAVPYHKTSKPYGDGYEYTQRDLADNTELVSFLKEQIGRGSYAAMLHGFSHEYKEVNGTWLPEMLWKDPSQIQQEVGEGKKHLENLLSTEIDVFVAPSNKLNEKTITALEQQHLNLSGIIGKSRDRKLDGKYIRNYLHRTVYKMRYNIPYGGIYKYNAHKELYAYPIKSEEYLMRIYHLCKAQNLPFVVYTHYWELLNNPEKKDILRKIYEFAMSDGAKLVPVSDCFHSIH